MLPLLVRQLLYPRYFYDYIVDDAKHFGADPTLVLSIMREESRFNPRAKSQAAARGLLQFIMTTALDIGRDIGRNVSHPGVEHKMMPGALEPGGVLRQGIRRQYKCGQRLDKTPTCHPTAFILVE